MTKSTKVCWTITDVFPGMQSQVVGLAEAIGLPTVHKRCRRRWPWGWLSLPWGNPLNQLTKTSDKLIPPWPDLVITSGRRSAPLALAIKKQNPKKTFCVHIQNPVFNINHFDLIAAPEHDHLEGPNIVTTKGALHKVTVQKIREGVKAHKGLFKDFPRPYSVVLLGGNTNRYKMPLKALENLIHDILKIREITGGSVLVTPSFRTPYRDVLTNALQKEPNIFLVDNKVNPYFAMLGLADTIFVTDDSVNMVCEACFTGKPVYILPLLKHGMTKPKKFIEGLVKEGIARPFEEVVESWIYTPFNDTEKIATLVREKMTL
ncbi:MAG: hypothetical protein ACD_16C00243G0002 [uncultured bacterium]|nr:MAG: hypothetical protein ACD_16C00243G0002 [uncultured bacterium]OFW68485.1 MAG: hypothetical protein A2X70_06560 [Alphaproteobacteria bacterium GWC2_42_16]OFW73109.1 MAG: hypothetical protein A2Z80_02335 [Alphaproteobacteria bacterium GWA2_41_27]OFW81505.1 MAG: hypothetical protein A3E50_06260 [Alphaproteobacteria bacterium RIFCSPHIGHO2_12_FULL_42_100]OFW85266.1 MAG: hypothetical protein A2W06_02090 [Alphaproteobacteria bacterium RBG_16_42_14]OFW92184.1 MAG: hypothetical protein A2W46_066